MRVGECVAERVCHGESVTDVCALLLDRLRKRHTVDELGDDVEARMRSVVACVVISDPRDLPVLERIQSRDFPVHARPALRVMGSVEQLQDSQGTFPCANKGRGALAATWEIADMGPSPFPRLVIVDRVSHSALRFVLMANHSNPNRNRRSRWWSRLKTEFTAERPAGHIARVREAISPRLRRAPSGCEGERPPYNNISTSLSPSPPTPPRAPVASRRNPRG